MHVNNEIGVVQDLDSIGRLCWKHNVFFHSDIAQSIGKFPIKVHEMGLDLACMTAHKIFGPKGIGAMFIDWERVDLNPLIMGGG